MYADQKDSRNTRSVTVQRDRKERSDAHRVEGIDKGLACEFLENSQVKRRFAVLLGLTGSRRLSIGAGRGRGDWCSHEQETRPAPPRRARLTPSPRARVPYGRRQRLSGPSSPRRWRLSRGVVLDTAGGSIFSRLARVLHHGEDTSILPCYFSMLRVSSVLCFTTALRADIAEEDPPFRAAAAAVVAWRATVAFVTELATWKNGRRVATNVCEYGEMEIRTPGAVAPRIVPESNYPQAAEATGRILSTTIR